jgi:hypothetical protein
VSRSERRERTREGREVRISPRGVFCEAAQDHFLELARRIGAYFAEPHRLGGGDASRDGRCVLALEWAAPRHELVEDDPERPDVAPEVDARR